MTVDSPDTRSRRPRTIVYIDGFNFYYGSVYYGSVKGTPYKWLDFRLCVNGGSVRATAPERRR
jgi:hypothetical protein